MPSHRLVPPGHKCEVCEDRDASYQIDVESRGPIPGFSWYVCNECHIYDKDNNLIHPKCDICGKNEVDTAISILYEDDSSTDNYICKACESKLRGGF